MTSVNSFLSHEVYWHPISATEFRERTQKNADEAERVTLSNGTEVAVSGHAYDNQNHMFSDEDAERLKSQMSRFRHESSEEFASSYVTMQDAEGEPLASMDLSFVTFYSTEELVSSLTSMSITRFVDFENATENEVGLRELQVSDERQMDRLEDLLTAEKELKAIYGNDIKVAYDSQSDEIVILTPDDVGYAQTKTGEEALEVVRMAIYNHTDDFDVDRAKEIAEKFG
ncbi:hypothetical protein [Nisaea sp.]|uniref:hypothetical protein n=1 Tax=Nisaea sp. TaxID=2024842 RepID=UPI003264246D